MAENYQIDKEIAGIPEDLHPKHRELIEHLLSTFDLRPFRLEEGKSLCVDCPSRIVGKTLLVKVRGLPMHPVVRITNKLGVCWIEYYTLDKKGNVQFKIEGSNAHKIIKMMVVPVEEVSITALVPKKEALDKFKLQAVES